MAKSGGESRTKKDVEKRAAELREQIREHDHRYYVENDPVISDAEYDEMMEELRGIETDNPELVTVDSPTQRVGGEPREEMGTVEHESPMLSLDAVREEEEFRHFLDRCRDILARERVYLVAEPKYDGASVEMIYEDGVLAIASTRGDGEKGEEITANVRTIPEVPLRLRDDAASVPRHLVVRGEAFMTKDEFAELNDTLESEGEKTFANPRNAAAGSLRQLDPKVTARRPLHVYVFELAPTSSVTPDTHWQALGLLGALGFKLDEHAKLVDSPDEAVEWHEAMSDQREELAYEIDGTVFKVNDLDAHETLGARSASPRWALAWKFASRRKTTRIDEIVAQVGRTGVVTPVAELDPVHIGGVEVSRVSLHNQDEIDRKDIRVGDHVLVERAGDVIPHVVKVIESERSGHEKEYSLPETCPSCGEKLTRVEGEAATRCTNASCPAQFEQSLLHFASKSGLDIDGLGERLVHQLYDRDLVRRIDDIFELTTEDLETLDLVEKKKARNLVEAIESAKNEASLTDLVEALGIPHTGRATAGVLARRFGSLDALADAEKDELEALDGIGETMADAIHGWFASDQNRKLLARLRERGLDPRQESRGSRLEGKTLVLTGSLSAMSREEAKDAIRKEGGRATSSVSSETDYLVVGDDPGRTKLDDAEEHGTEIVHEDRFLELLARPIQET